MKELPDICALAGIAFCLYALAIIYAASIWQIYRANRHPGWYCLIPFLNIYILAKDAGIALLGELAIVLCLVSCFGVFPATVTKIVLCLVGLLILWALYRVSRKQECSKAFSLGVILLGVIFIPWLGVRLWLRMRPTKENMPAQGASVAGTHSAIRKGHRGESHSKKSGKSGNEVLTRAKEKAQKRFEDWRKRDYEYLGPDRK